MIFFSDKPALSERRAEPRRAVEGRGEVVVKGTPEQVAEEPRSNTGGHLRLSGEGPVGKASGHLLRRESRFSSSTGAQRHRTRAANTL